MFLPAITHVIIEGCVNKIVVATRFVDRLRVPAVLVFGSWIGVSTQIASFQ